MRNTKAIAVIAAEALIAFAVLVAPVNAQPGPQVPETPNIVDPVDDANYVNDQGSGAPIPNDQDAGDASTVADIMAVWFSDTADTISVHIQTQRPGPATAAIFYRVRIDPGSGTSCFFLQGRAPGAGNAGTPGASYRDLCTSGPTTAEGEFVQTPGPEETGIHTITMPRSIHAVFEADGSVLAKPMAETTHLIAAPTGQAVFAPMTDNTDVGTDYIMGSGGGGGDGDGGPKPTATGTGDPAPTASPGTTPSPKPTSPPDKDKKKKKCSNKKKGSNSKKCKKKKCSNKKKGSNSKKCKKKKGKGRGPSQPKPSPSPTSTHAPTPAPTSEPPTPSPTPTG